MQGCVNMFAITLPNKAGTQIQKIHNRNKMH